MHPLNRCVNVIRLIVIEKLIFSLRTSKSTFCRNTNYKDINTGVKVYLYCYCVFKMLHEFVGFEKVTV